MEIDGEQHKGNSEWGGNTKVHDSIKNQFCSENGIPLYRVKYKFGRLDILEKEIMNILNAEFSEDLLNAGNDRSESQKVMTDQEISRAVNSLSKSLKSQIKENNQIINHKKTIPIGEIKVGLKVNVEIPKKLAMEKGISKHEKGTIIKTTEKAIMISNKSKEFWLPKYFIKVYKEG